MATATTVRNPTNNGLDRPPITTELQNRFRPTPKPPQDTGDGQPMMTSMLAPFEPQTLLRGKRTYARISPARGNDNHQPQPKRRAPTTCSLKAGHFCLVELLKLPPPDNTTTTTTTTTTSTAATAETTTTTRRHLWWPCLLLETKEMNSIFKDLEFVLETTRLKNEYTFTLLSASLAKQIETRQINLVGSSDGKRSLVTFLLGDELPPGYQRSYFDNASKTTKATGRGRRVFVAGPGTEWQDQMKHLMEHYYFHPSSQPSPVQKAIVQCHKLMSHFLQMKPSLDYDTSEVDLLALGDQDEAEQAPLSPPQLELQPRNAEQEEISTTTTAPEQQEVLQQPDAATAVPKLNLPPRRSAHEETPRPRAASRAKDSQQTTSAAVQTTKRSSSKSRKSSKQTKNAPPDTPKPRMQKRKSLLQVGIEEDSDATIATTNTLERPAVADDDATAQVSKKQQQQEDICQTQESSTGEALAMSFTSDGEENDSEKETAVAKSDDDSKKKKKNAPPRKRRNSGKSKAKKTKTTPREKKTKKSPKAAASSTKKKSKNYKDMDGEVDIPRWYDVKKILLEHGYEFGTLLPNSNGMIYARPFGNPSSNFPNSAKLGQDYFCNVASFRAHLCAHGLDYVSVPPKPEEQEMVNRWCRYSIAADYATPKFSKNRADFKLDFYEMKFEMAHKILHKKLGFKFKDKGIHQGYQWPGETKLHQLMEDKDMWIRLARFGLPKGLPLEKLEGGDHEVLALLLCIADRDLEKRPILLNHRTAPPQKQTNDASVNKSDNGIADDQMDADSAEADEMDVDPPKDGEEIASDPQEPAAAEREMELDSSTEKEQPISTPAVPQADHTIIPASQALSVDSEAIARCNQAPEAVSPRDARQNLVSSFAKAQESSPVLAASKNGNQQGAEDAQNESNTAVATNVGGSPARREETVAEFFTETDEEHSPAREPNVSEPQEPPEESTSTLESWFGSQSANEVVLPGISAKEKLNACLEALKVNHDDELVVGGSLATSLDKIDAFMKKVIDARGLVPNAYLHVCGGPGVGKTAGINACVKKMKKYWSEQASKSIDKSILDEPTFLILKGSEFQNLSTADAMAKTFERNGKKITLKALQKPADLEDSRKAAIILVLDEVDMLVSRQGTEEYLRQVIEHASDENMMLGMIGISNSIENARLNNLGLTGQRVVFGTYDKEDLVDIITSKIGKGVVDEKAVEYLASKVSATSGDLRSMLGLVSSAIEACQAKLSTDKLAEPLTGLIVKLPHAVSAAKALTTKFKEIIESLPQYERYALCCGVNLSKALKWQELDFEHFHKLCTYAFGYECQLTIEALADLLDRLADKDLLRFEKSTSSSRAQVGYLQRKIRLDRQSEDVIGVLENGIEKEPFFKRMKKRCDEIAHSYDRQSRQL